MLHLRVCSKTGLFSPYDDFLFTGRQRAFTEKLKGMKISIVRGTSSETRAFQRAGFYLNIKRKESSPPPLTPPPLLFSMSQRDWSCVTTLSWCFQDRKSLMCNLVVWPNRPDVELRRSWHLAFGHIFVSEKFKYILQVLHKWKCNKMKNPLWHFSCCTGL